MRTVVHLFVPGPFEQRTGGYIYDQRVVTGLRARDRRVRVHELVGCFPEHDAAASRSLAAAAEACEPGDVVIVDSLCLGAAIPALRRLADRPCASIALVHHPASLENTQDDPPKPLFSDERQALALVNRCVATSPATATLLHELFSVGWDRIGVVVPGVDRCALAPGAVDGVPRHLLAVGTVSRRKDQVTLVRAVARLTDLPWSLRCVGSLDREPRAAHDVHREIRQHDLANRVRLDGEAGEPELSAAYAWAHLFVMSSRFEGYGMVLTEALARGLPIVATDAGPTADILSGENAIVVPPGEPQTFANALRGVLTDRRTYLTLRDGAHRAAAAFEGWDKTAARFDAELNHATA